MFLWIEKNLFSLLLERLSGIWRSLSYTSWRQSPYFGMSWQMSKLSHCALKSRYSHLLRNVVSFRLDFYFNACSLYFYLESWFQKVENSWQGLSTSRGKIALRHCGGCVEAKEELLGDMWAGAEGFWMLSDKGQRVIVQLSSDSLFPQVLKITF